MTNQKKNINILKIQRTANTKGEPVSPVEKQVEMVKKLPEDRIAIKPVEEKREVVTEKLNQALAENKKLLAASDSVRKERDAFRLQTEQMRKEMDRLRSTLEAGTREKAEAERTISEIKSEMNYLQALILEMKSNAAKEQDARLEPEKVKMMVADFEKSLSGSLTGYMVKDIELRLKVSVEQHGNDELIMLLAQRDSVVSTERLSDFVVRMIPDVTDRSKD